jgi:hypothetical protein
MSGQTTTGALRAEEIAKGELRWFCLKYVDGRETLGMVILQAYGPVDASVRATEEKFDPGRGTILATIVPDEHLPEEDKRSKLLSYDEIRKLWPEAK